MRPAPIRKRWKYIISIFLACVVVTYFVWTTGHLVLAFQENKIAHIFPTSVTARGWENYENALNEELPPTAPFASFKENNSAFIRIEGSTLPPAENPPIDTGNTPPSNIDIIEISSSTQVEVFPPRPQTPEP